jgi:microcompartment protein CcmL/EutN
VTSTLDDTTRAAQDQFLGAVRQGQQAVVDAVAACATAVKELTPSIPTVPSSTEIPRPQEIVDNAFDFAQKLLDAQRDFAHNVISAAAPAIQKATPSPQKPPV